MPRDSKSPITKSDPQADRKRSRPLLISTRERVNPKAQLPSFD